MSRVEELFNEAASAAEFAGDYLGYLTEVLRALDAEAIGRVATLLVQAARHDRAVYLVGNGGSAATACHMANDLVSSTRGSERGLRAHSLAADLAVITAIANDLGYDQIFVEQLRGRLKPGDVVIAISASGGSANVLRAVEYANEAGAVTVGFTGFDGGRLKELVSMGVHVPTAVGDYGPVEDAHIALDHILGSYLRLRLRAALEEAGAA